MDRLRMPAVYLCLIALGVGQSAGGEKETADNRKEERDGLLFANDGIL